MSVRQRPTVPNSPAPQALVGATSPFVTPGALRTSRSAIRNNAEECRIAGGKLVENTIIGSALPTSCRTFLCVPSTFHLHTSRAIRPHIPRAPKTASRPSDKKETLSSLAREAMTFAYAAKLGPTNPNVGAQTINEQRRSGRYACQ